jgi:hypothetical protein
LHHVPDPSERATRGNFHVGIPGSDREGRLLEQIAEGASKATVAQNADPAVL